MAGGSMSRRCETCRYSSDEVCGWLSCHRYPPVVPSASDGYAGSGLFDVEIGVLYTGYPTVSPDEWCGEWRKRKKGDRKHGYE